MQPSVIKAGVSGSIKYFTSLIKNINAFFTNKQHLLGPELFGLKSSEMTEPDLIISLETSSFDKTLPNYFTRNLVVLRDPT